MALTLVLAAPVSAQVAGDVPVLGDWVAELRHNDQTARLGLRLRAAEQGIAVALAIPAIDSDEAQLGIGQWRDGVLAVGPWQLEFDATTERLKGTLPGFLVPVHVIPVVFERGELPVGTPSQRPRAVEPTWRVEIGTPVYAGIATSGDLVFVGADDGKVRALEIATGDDRWQQELGGAIRATPTPRGEVLLVHADDESLACLDLATGEPRWRTTLEAAPVTRDTNAYQHFSASPVVAGGRVLVGTAAGSLIACDLETGEEVWRAAMGGAALAAPAVASGRAIIGSFDGSVRAFDLDSGEPGWRYDTGGAVVSTPALAGDSVVVGSRSYDLFALEAASGEVAWTRYFWFSWVESSACVRDGVVYVGSSDAQEVRAYSSTDGAPRWATDVDGWAWGTPAVDDEVVIATVVGAGGYITAHRGGLWALERSSGKPRWMFEPEAAAGNERWGFAASPALAGDLVLAADLAGVVYAFAR